MRTMLISSRHTFLALAVVMSLSASTHAVHAQDTLRVRNSAAPRWGATVTLSPIWSIGQVDGPDEVAFGQVSQFAADRTGRFYVFDEKDKQIREYSAAAKFIRNVGRNGKGPGEYVWVFGMDIADDSLLTIFDLSNARISTFAPDGTIRSSFTDGRLTWGIDNIFAVESRGLIYAPVPRQATRGAPAMDETAMTARPTILIYRRDGRVTDSITLPTATRPPVGSTFYLSTADGGNNNFLAGSHSASLRSGGYVAGHGAALRLIIHPINSPPRVVERAATTIAVGSDERANWNAWAEYFGAQSGGTRRYEIPTIKPVFRDLITDYDSRIWVSMYAPAEKISLTPRATGDKRPLLLWQQRATYDVFSNLGDYLGRVVLPMRARMLAARGDQLWVLAKGADDADVIRLYRMSGVK